MTRPRGDLSLAAAVSSCPGEARRCAASRSGFREGRRGTQSRRTWIPIQVGGASECHGRQDAGQRRERRRRPRGATLGDVSKRRTVWREGKVGVRQLKAWDPGPFVATRRGGPRAVTSSRRRGAQVQSPPRTGARVRQPDFGREEEERGARAYRGGEGAGGGLGAIRGQAPERRKGKDVGGGTGSGPRACDRRLEGSRPSKKQAQSSDLGRSAESPREHSSPSVDSDGDAAEAPTASIRTRETRSGAKSGSSMMRRACKRLWADLGDEARLAKWRKSLGAPRRRLRARHRRMPAQECRTQRRPHGLGRDNGVREGGSGDAGRLDEPPRGRSGRGKRGPCPGHARLDRRGGDRTREEPLPVFKRVLRRPYAGRPGAGSSDLFRPRGREAAPSGDGSSGGRTTDVVSWGDGRDSSGGRRGWMAGTATAAGV
ncbi:hypothetical protein THAOC_00374 [Thalassiosira oceanica]|uniref:Uncharacterized protein n=1 Tax=Thalassiosira oceanica TaxID=159749 RepID=K0TGC9_THAOC|nr:hypothetical protein THAOC_00374 [Thalassiosira oceanica]|eukprot:EJK77773.1 hypothetical protein THAOC_00374 [Thalassiosira oceanica]